MTKLSTLLIFLQLSITACGQVVDRAPTANQNILPVEGGGIKMDVDTTTLLPELISKLNSKWEFNETGKGYWIGYTEDMFSIANRGNAAIPELIKFFKTNANDKGKIGALYTLHLIGIEGKIVGRFTEDFKNKDARAALLSVLPDKKYTFEIVTLLMRDPWKSDIPILLEMIKNEKEIDVIWPIINSLNRYQIETLPINNAIPKKILEQKIILNVKHENVLERDFDFNAQIKQAMKAFNEIHSNINIDTELYSQELSPHYRTKLNSNLSLESFLMSTGISRFNPFGYSTIGCKFQYYFENNTFYFITIKTAQKKIVEWWNLLSSEEKRKLY